MNVTLIDAHLPIRGCKRAHMFDDKSNPETNLKDLGWLVENRSINQKSTLRVYGLIIEYKELFANNKGYRSSAQNLLGVAFSLWRAVFLADIKKKRGSMLSDVEGFLVELIQNNAITYVQDRKTRDWTFRYYMDNANHRLKNLFNKFEHLGHSFKLPGSSEGKSTQEWWRMHQDSFDDAITKFEDFLKAKLKRRLQTKTAKPRRARVST
jgi:hypothetical protein